MESYSPPRGECREAREGGRRRENHYSQLSCQNKHVIAPCGKVKCRWTPSISRDWSQQTAPTWLFLGLGGPLLAALLISSVSALKAGFSFLLTGFQCLICAGRMNSAQCVVPPARAVLPVVFQVFWRLNCGPKLCCGSEKP